MTQIKDTCGWCNQHIDLTPDDVILTLPNPRSGVGTYRFTHCDQVTMRRSHERISAVLLAAGVNVEYTDDDYLKRCRISSEVSNFAAYLDSIETPADMGFVS